jgi:hypothetical protein
MARKPRPIPSDYAKSMVLAWGKDKAYVLACQGYQECKRDSPLSYWWHDVMRAIQPPPPPPPPPADIEKACAILKRNGIGFRRYGDVLVF